MTKTTIVENESEKQLKDLFLKKRALLQGHFLLSSGLHSDYYFQSALLLQEAPVAEDLGKRLASICRKFKANVVISPAIGGLIIGHEVARALNLRHIFSEKDDTGKPVLRRGFELKPDEQALIIEDVVTTGLSTREVMRIVEDKMAKVAGIGCIVNRCTAPTVAALGTEFEKAVQHLLRIPTNAWKSSDCDLCKKGIPVVKPGSRKT